MNSFLILLFLPTGKDKTGIVNLKLQVKVTKKIWFLCLFLLLLPLGLWAHPLHVSLCQVDFNPKEKTLQISVKIFADDLLNALKRQKVQDLFLGEENEDPKSDEYIFNYLKSNLAFIVNGNKSDYRYIGKEMEDDAVWCFVQINNITDLKKIEVNNRVLTEVFNDQNNIVEVNRNGKILNLLLNRKNPSGILDFSK